MMIVTLKSRYARRGGRGNSWLAFEDNNSVCKVSRHDEVVLDYKGRLFRVKDKSTTNHH